MVWGTLFRMIVWPMAVARAAKEPMPQAVGQHRHRVAWDGHRRRPCAAEPRLRAEHIEKLPTPTPCAAVGFTVSGQGRREIIERRQRALKPGRPPPVEKFAGAT